MEHHERGQVEDIGYVREGKINLDFREIGSQCVKWIHLAVHSFQYEKAGINYFGVRNCIV
jgi:hypothetical protein